MKRIGWMIVILISLILMILYLFRTHVHGTKPMVMVVLKTLSTPYWKSVARGVNDCCRELGVRCRVIGPPSETSVMKQVHLIEDCFTQMPDAVILAPILPQTLPKALDRLNINVPVLFIDTNVHWPRKTAYVGINHYIAGEKGGEALANVLQKNDQVALLSGVLGNLATDQRIRGAKDALIRNGIKIVSEQPCDSDKAKAMAAMENILEANPTIKGVYAANDEMALGALRAMKEKRLTVKVMGTDGTIDAVKAILKGKMHGTVAQNPYKMGYMAVEGALSRIKGKKVSPWLDSGVALILVNNAKEKLFSLIKRYR